MQIGQGIGQRIGLKIVRLYGPLGVAAKLCIS
jgi:hypothetical protein